MSYAIDLPAYLRRIGFQGEAKPDVATLRALAVAHVAAIPFENLDPFLGIPVVLEPRRLERKLVEFGRGGYCFEQNFVFREVLRAIGYPVRGLIARVLWQRDDDDVTAQSHMLLRIEIDGESWLADVGFGGMVLPGALKLVPLVEQVSTHEPYRLLEQGGIWRMQALVREQWQTLYRFDLQPKDDVDYVVANHYTSTFPESHFLHGLNIARTVPGRRLTLRSRDFAVHTLGGETVRRTLTDTDEILDVLEREFLLRVPQVTHLRARIDAMPLPSPVVSA
ncbi:arylamine N-acetyltransferase [Dyella sp. LX-66]|uniref:arylamine N-acetyltransferase family protein n=1 Tax=unclassified Dyella TaxID=2634549 RepID=UPI001BE0D2E9|nr:MULTISPECIES: arylamine N-acetyltransferase [unclassified Dyella]MBT2118147.1 arylamine N-acetyltransferase [Dyella sp. LX-1]MBT2138827.1 arylamine N-acetyltransferase [Dyella sp. LX-66]